MRKFLQGICWQTYLAYWKNASTQTFAHDLNLSLEKFIRLKNIIITKIVYVFITQRCIKAKTTNSSFDNYYSNFAVNRKNKTGKLRPASTFTLIQFSKYRFVPLFTKRGCLILGCFLCSINFNFYLTEFIFDNYYYIDFFCVLITREG